MPVKGAVEGITDEAVLRRIAAHVGISLGDVYGGKGKQDLVMQLPRYNRAARYAPWLVLIDLDENSCAPDFRRQLLSEPAVQMHLRVAVREVESWLLADTERLAKFLNVSTVKIPKNPDLLPDPKGVIVNLARLSKRREIREDMAPRPASGRSVGPAYASRLIEFVQADWRPHIAAKRSPSLRKCLAAADRIRTDDP